MLHVAAKAAAFFVVLGLLALSGAHWASTAQAGHYKGDGTPNYEYAVVQNVMNGPFLGVKASMYTPNPEVRTTNGASTQRIMIGLAVCGRLEVGWDKKSSFSSPQYYWGYTSEQCVFHGPNYEGTPAVGSTHSYKIQHRGGTTWDIYIDDELKTPDGVTIGGLNQGYRVEAGGEAVYFDLPGNPAYVMHNAMGPTNVLDLQYKLLSGVWTTWDVTQPTNARVIDQGYVLQPLAPGNNFSNYGYNGLGTSSFKQRLNLASPPQAVIQAGIDAPTGTPKGLGLFSTRAEYSTAATTVLSGNVLSPYHLQNYPSPSGGAITVDGIVDSFYPPGDQENAPQAPVLMAEVSLVHNGDPNSNPNACQNPVWTVEYFQQLGTHVHIPGEPSNPNDPEFQFTGIQVFLPPAPIPPNDPRYLLRGDAKADGTIDENDAMFIAQHIVGLRNLSAAGVAVNAASPKHDSINPTPPPTYLGPDRITIADTLLIRQYVVGLRDKCFNLVP